MAATAAKTIKDTAAESQKVLNDNMEKAAKSFEQFAAMNQDVIGAMMKSQGVAAKAVEEVNAEIIAFSKKSLEDGVAHAKDLAGSQTVTEFVEKQTGFAKTAFEAAVQQSTRVNEMMSAAAKEMMAPVQGYMSSATEQFKAFRA